MSAASGSTSGALGALSPEDAAWIAGLGAAVPREDDPWLEPLPEMAQPPELEVHPDGPR
mgnify:CR=1 FL=1